MHSRPLEAHPRKDSRYKHSRPSHPHARQHGNHAHGHDAASGARHVLLSLPSESLTHITSFLEPPALLVLAQTCKQLHAHVADDNTWRRAFVYQYLGIAPETDLCHDAGNKTLMLRREAGSWRKEFILRYSLRRYVMSSLSARKGVVVSSDALFVVYVCSLLLYCCCCKFGYRLKIFT